MDRLQSILIFDNDHYFKEHLKFILKDDFRIVTVDNSLSMYQILELDEISILVLDYSLNEPVSGIEISINVKKNYPFLKIIMISSLTSFELLKAAINSGAVDSFINKPIEEKETVKIIKDTAKNVKKRDSKIAHILDKLKQKEAINEEIINEMGGEINLLNMLYNESLTSSPLSPNRCVGITIFKNRSVYMQKFLYSELQIDNEYLFTGFLNSLRDFAMNFKDGASNQQELNIGDMRIHILHNNEFIYSLFLTGDKTKDYSEILTSFIYNLHDMVLSDDYIFLHEKVNNMILSLNEKILLK